MRGFPCIALLVFLAVTGVGCIDSVPGLDASHHTDAVSGFDTAHAVDVGPAMDATLDVPPAADGGMDVSPTVDVVAHPDAHTDAGTPDVPPPSIALSGVASAMALNTSTGVAYVALACNGGAPGCPVLSPGEQTAVGIAVVDSNHDTLSTTIPPLTAPPGGTGSSVYNAMAVDTVANVVYVAAGSDFIWTINGTVNAASGSIAGSVLAGTQIQAMTDDPVAQILYVATLTSASTVNLVMINTATTAVIGTPIPVTGLAGASGLALDTTHQRLFVCGSGPDVAEVDTATGVVLGDGGVTSYAGQGPTVACGGIPGYAEMVTQGGAGGAGVIHALEQMDYPLSVSFAPASAATVQFTPTSVATYAFGIRAENAHIAYSYVQWNPVTSSMIGSGGPTVVFTTPAGPVGPAAIVRTGATTFDAYVITNALTSVSLTDGGTDMVPTVSTINRVTIPVPATL